MAKPQKIATVAALFIVSLLLDGCEQETKPTSYTGYVEANYLYINAPGSGWITEQQVKQGDSISPGQMLYALDSTQQQAQLAASEAKLQQQQHLLADSEQGARTEEIAVLQQQKQQALAELKLAELEMQRAESTAKQQLTSLSVRDKAVSAYQVAQAAVDTIERQITVARLSARSQQRQALQSGIDAIAAQIRADRWQLQQRQIIAMRTGTVDQLFYRKGEFVNQGQPLLSLLLDQSLKVRFFVPQALLAKLTLGQQVKVHADGIGSVLEAKIDRIAKDAEFTPPVLYSKSSRDKLVFLVEALLPDNSALKPGLPVDVEL